MYENEDVSFCVEDEGVFRIAVDIFLRPKNETQTLSEVAALTELATRWERESHGDGCKVASLER